MKTNAPVIECYKKYRVSETICDNCFHVQRTVGFWRVDLFQWIHVHLFALGSRQLTMIENDKSIRWRFSTTSTLHLVFAFQFYFVYSHRLSFFSVSEITPYTEYSVEFVAAGNKLAMLIILGPDFPMEKPLLKITPSISHQYVNENSEITNAPGYVNVWLHFSIVIIFS